MSVENDRPFASNINFHYVEEIEIATGDVPGSYQITLKGRDGAWNGVQINVWREHGDNARLPRLVVGKAEVVA